jgi:hypothetical protein
LTVGVVVFAPDTMWPSNVDQVNVAPGVVDVPAN